MSHFKSIAERLADQAKAREKLSELARKISARKFDSKQQTPKPNTVAPAPFYLLSLGSRAYRVRGLMYALEAHMWIIN